MTAAENPLLSPAFLGYKFDRARGDVVWRVCGWCQPDDKVPVEREAERLCVRITHGICEPCRVRMMGETLPGITSEQLQKGGA